MRKAGREIYRIEDPTQRKDFAGLKLIRHAIGPTFLNSGEYLDVHGKRLLLESAATDMLNVHGQITDVMRIGWLAAKLGVPVTLGNTFLEVGVNLAIALPEVAWLDYSFQNFEHFEKQPYALRDDRIWGSNSPGHGLALSEPARKAHHCPQQCIVFAFVWLPQSRARPIAAILVRLLGWRLVRRGHPARQRR